VLISEQFKGLLAELKQPYRAMVIVAGCTRLRVSEIIGLEWGDLDWRALTLSVNRSVVAGREGATKTRASKKPVPIDPAVATKLLNWRGQAHYLNDSDFVFAGNSGKRKMAGDDCERPHSGRR